MNGRESQREEMTAVARAFYARPEEWDAIRTIDAHAAGEPLRVVVDGLPPIPGATMLEKRRFARERLDAVRRRLMWEPRGHADMYGAFITEPVAEDSDLGVLFLHNEGFSTMCGHGIIALTKILVDTGMVPPGESPATIRIDTPAGLVVAHAAHEGGRVRRVAFENVPSFVYRRGVEVRLPGIGETVCDIAFGGAYYAFCEAGDLGLTLTPAHHDRLIEVGRLVKRAVLQQVAIEDPVAPDLGFLYGVIFTGPAEEEGHHSRHVCIFAEGEVDRSPTGTGVSGRAALLHDSGQLPEGETIVIESILGTCFAVTVAGRSEVAGCPAVIPRVSGEAYLTGTSTFFAEPGDALGDGFIFR
jgi:trans-L-3-hydroxyproline dehydratase